MADLACECDGDGHEADDTAASASFGATDLLSLAGAGNMYSILSCA